MNTKSPVSADSENNVFRFDITPSVLQRLPGPHEFVYILDYDLSALARTGRKTPVELIQELLDIGQILAGQVRLASADITSGLPRGPLSYVLLYSTILSPDFMPQATGLDEKCIFSIGREQIVSGCTISYDSKARTVSRISPDTSVMPASALRSSEKDDDLDDLPVTPDMIEQFVVESDDTLEQVEHFLCSLSDEPERAREIIGESFRMIHNFKGHSALLGLKDFERLSHRMESLLSHFREHPESCDRNCRDLLLRGLDILHESLSDLSENGDVLLPESLEVIELMDEMLPALVSGEQHSAASSREKQRNRKEALKKRSVQRHNIRVDLEKLDHLLNLVGELVIAESMVTRNTAADAGRKENFERSAHNLRRIIDELQSVVMSIRMVPLTRTFRRLLRLVHDLAARSRKQARLRLIGENTEMDKTIIEQITDPLVHIIRNCVDHGLETPEERIRSGKPENGTITVEARHEGGEVVIHISDDGKGLNRKNILAQAIRKGIVSGNPENMSDEEVFQLIFEAGLSTAERVTDISGRGIGMEVVRRNIEKLKGRVNIDSIPGKGTNITLNIPLTLAIIDGMLIRIGKASYTIPLLSIRESFRPSPGQITRTMSGQEFVRLRNEMIPVIRLHKIYNIEPEYRELDQGILINVTSGLRSVCFFADEIIGHHQTVIKGMPEYIGIKSGISGCTILEDGEVGLILDVGHIITMMERQGEVHQKRTGSAAAHPVPDLQEV